MKQSIIRNPEFFHILADLNYGELERKKSRNFLYYDLDVLQNYFYAFESLVNVIAYESEGSDNNMV
tara:strand:- start:382 stop:579 length:198 start_codon:yes stop_codon:yes gene_type:complete